MNNLKLPLSLLLWYTCVMSGLAQESYRIIRGEIYDQQTREPIIGATLFIQELNDGSTTDIFGAYELKLPKEGAYSIIVRSVGYKEVVIMSDDLDKDIPIYLEAEIEQMKEVVVQATQVGWKVSPEGTSVARIGVEEMQSIPALLGETDVIKSIQLLPGVSGVGEGASGFNVRGGSVGENLALLDEVPMFNTSHLFGLFSVFNPDAIDGVSLLKGGIPVEYGGRLSSVLDVKTKEVDNTSFAGQGGIGVIFSRLTLEVPIAKEKVSLLVSGRRSYVDWLARPFLGDQEGTAFNFYDLTTKLQWKINAKNELSFTTYAGKDTFEAIGFIGFEWGDRSASLQWKHLFSDQLLLKTTTYWNDYRYAFHFGNEKDAFDWSAKVNSYSGRSVFSYFLNDRNTVTFGGQVSRYNFYPGKAENIVYRNTIPTFELPKMNALEGSVFLGNEQQLTEQWSLNYGIRFSSFAYVGAGVAKEYREAEEKGQRKVPIPEEERVYTAGQLIQYYPNLEPRIAATYQWKEEQSIRVSYHRMTQSVHLISNTAASSPLDIWYPSTNNIRPQLADQFSLGYQRDVPQKGYEFSVELYYKHMTQMVDFIDGADLLLNSNLEGDLLEGIGRAYGVEWQLKKTEGKFNGWISYTLSRSERKTEGINQDEWYAARFDQTHNLSVVGIYEWNPVWKCSANFSFISGTPTTAPSNTYELHGYSPAHNPENRRNNYRIPSYHRLDLSLTYDPISKGRWDGQWVFSVYNVYNRQNPFSVSFQPNTNGLSSSIVSNNEAIQFSLIGSIVPSVAYNFRF
ncbi:TonB-dependent receptor [Algivirga pacifica]|uniref:TonB-dependent receptor n=1 Tax=Algivirga pacifica TaxID=1162670 RepID=A0ABP9DLE2_9BACT